jgi:fermentation-respiration switch protein FrsA (DUF1100 family)
MGLFLPFFYSMKRGKPPMNLPGVVKASRDVAGGQQVTLELETEGEHVPAILLLPDRRSTPVAGALLLHGFTSRKERMAEGIGRALLARGVATLAIDLPLHGAREGRIDELSLRNPLKLVGAWRLALAEVRLSLDSLSQLDVVDERRLALVGYSLGSFLSVVAAADDARVRAMVLASGGDLPDRTPFARLVRAVADPLRAVRRFAGRPLLMVNGRFDRTITPAQAERLYEAAREPKQIHWYSAGHWTPQNAVSFAADWLADRLGDARSGSRRRTESAGAD